MKAVHLTRLLVLEQPMQTPDGAGGYATSWAEIGTLWAEVLPGAGRDTGGEEVTLSRIPYRITVRAAPEGSDRRPVPGQRLRQGGRLFRILAVTERDAAGQYLTCFSREEEPA
ncbi:MAG: head-tail adaptor protein [Rhodobacteraceae bacterium]|nr:head-tail adaptor protein [Paracoccaceae bacterium]